MTYSSIPFDTARVAKVLADNCTAQGKKTAAYCLAMESLNAGQLDKLTMLHVRDCGRKALKAVKLDLHHQSFEIRLGKK